MFDSEHNVNRDLVPPCVVLTGSQGAYVPVLEILNRLPRGFPAAILLVLHRAPTGADYLPAVIRSRTRFEATVAEEREPLRPGVVHVAPRGADLLVAPDGTIGWSLSSEGRIHDSADRVMTSVAASLGERTIGVVLSGRLHDGARGARAIKTAGGRVLVQDPATAEHPSMPSAALATGCVDFALPPQTLAAALMSFVMVPGAAALFRVRLHPAAAVAAG